MRTSYSTYAPLVMVLICVLYLYLSREEKQHLRPELPIAMEEECEVLPVSPRVEIQVAETPRQPVEQAQATQAAAPVPVVEDSQQLVTLRSEVSALRNRIHALESELSRTSGQVALWASTLRPEERPTQEILALMAEYLHDYPVELRTEEGLWLAERITKDDWKLWGPTVDEAIFTYLGEVRLSKELSPEQFARCKP